MATSCSLFQNQDNKAFVTVISGKDDVTSQVLEVNGIWVVEIHIQSGIGSAEIEYGRDRQELVLRLFPSSLEHLQIERGTISVGATASSTPPYTFRQSAASGSGTEKDLSHPILSG